MVEYAEGRSLFAVRLRASPSTDAGPVLTLFRSVGGVQRGIAPGACPELVEGAGVWENPQKDTFRAGG